MTVGDGGGVNARTEEERESGRTENIYLYTSTVLYVMLTIDGKLFFPENKGKHILSCL